MNKGENMTNEPLVSTTDADAVALVRPGHATWTPAVYCYTETGQRPPPTVVQLNPDGSVWVDWEAVQRYCERFPIKPLEHQHGMEVLHILLALHDGRIADTAWSEVVPVRRLSTRRR